MLTRRGLSLLLLLCALATPVVGAQLVSIAVDTGLTVVEFDAQEFVVETTAPIVVHFSSRGGQVTAEVDLRDDSATSASVRITSADDPDHVIFFGVVRDSEDFENLFFHDEVGRGEG